MWFDLAKSFVCMILFDLPVSHIYTLTVPPVFNGTGFVANSTPMVGYLVLGSYPLIYRLSK